MSWYKRTKLSQEQSQTIKLYHGTSSGANDANITSFMAGVDPEKGKDYGQGIGFYGYNDMQSAAKVANTIANESKSLPMIVEVDAPSSLIELDFEHQYPAMVNIIANNWDLFQSLEPFTTDDKTLLPKESTRNSKFNTISFAFENKPYPRKLSLGYGEQFTGGGIYYGELIYDIISQMINAKRDLKQEINRIAIQSIKPGVEIKYIGGIIKPTNIYVLFENRWISANKYLSMSKNKQSVGILTAQQQNRMRDSKSRKAKDL